MTQDSRFVQAKAEASRLKSLLKAAEKERALLTDPVEKAAAKERVKDLQSDYLSAYWRVLELKEEYRWGRCVDREFDCIAVAE